MDMMIGKGIIIRILVYMRQYSQVPLQTLRMDILYSSIPLCKIQCLSSSKWQQEVHCEHCALFNSLLCLSENDWAIFYISKICMHCRRLRRAQEKLEYYVAFAEHRA